MCYIQTTAGRIILTSHVQSVFLLPSHKLLRRLSIQSKNIVLKLPIALSMSVLCKATKSYLGIEAYLTV